MDDLAFNSQWYAVDPEGKVRFIGDGLKMVDAGDYDNDGKSEVIFKISKGESGAGYAIYYDDFRKHADLTFSYH